MAALDAARETELPMQDHTSATPATLAAAHSAPPALNIEDPVSATETEEHLSAPLATMTGTPVTLTTAPVFAAMESQRHAIESMKTQVEESVKSQRHAIESVKTQVEESVKSHIQESQRAVITTFDSKFEGFKATIANLGDDMEWVKTRTSKHEETLQDHEKMLKELQKTKALGSMATPPTGIALPKFKVPNFDGTTSRTAFQHQFEVVSKGNGWEDDCALTALTLSLRGDALLVLETLPADRRSLEALFKALEARYEDKHLEHVYRAKLKERIQKSNEGLQQWATEIERLVRRAYASVDEIIVQAFIEGIRDREVRVAVRLGHHTTLYAALAHALEVEALRSELNAHEVQEVVAPVRPRIRHGHGGCGERGHIRINCKLSKTSKISVLLENSYTFHDYNIKLNDVIQLMVRAQPEREDSPKEKTGNTEKEDRNLEVDKKGQEYKDAESTLYTVGDLIDMRDREQGAWFEGKITRIVYNPDIPNIPDINNTSTSDTEVLTNSDNSDNTNKKTLIYNSDNNQSYDKENCSEKKSPSRTMNGSTPKSKNIGIAAYFKQTPNGVRKKPSKVQKAATKDQHIDEKLLFKVQLDNETDSDYYCKLQEIRPRARTEIHIDHIQDDQKVMINHNTDHPLEKGNWYDFKVSKVKKNRSNYDLIGTLYLGPEAIPQNDTKVRLLDKIFAIEEVVPVAERTHEYKIMMTTPPEKRSVPLNCLVCRDDKDTPCKDCGCYLCAGKEFPDKIVLCDECDNGYHMICLEPPLTELPEEDWYCPSCKRDPNEVVAPGASKQTKKINKTNRDWGRGMACVGKTKTCAMPSNHFGPIPGIEVGMCWRFRIQLSETGVHRPPVSGIHGRDVEGAYSIVLSGGYEDDVDYGNEFTYTGSGGRDLSGNKRTAEQSCDQTLTRENKALARNCAVKQISEEGGDAGDDWKHGRPVRVVRSYKMMKHFPKYAPSEGIRYDGIYKVVKYYPENGLSGFRVWKYLLRRDDPSPAPWEPGSKEYTIIYPDGYLEAEAEKKALKEKNKGKNVKTKAKGNKKRALRESNQSAESEQETSPPVKRRKTSLKKADSKDKPAPAVSPQRSIASIFTKSPKSKKANTVIGTKTELESALSTEEREAIRADTLNSKLWDECLIVCDTRGKKAFVEYVTQVFVCIICQEVAASPVTTPCLHNFCMACLKLAFKSSGAQCPCCRQSLAGLRDELEPNEKLRTALRSVMAGYDAGKK